MKDTKKGPKDGKVVFLTGSTGHVGRNLIPLILEEEGVSRLVVLIRAESDKELAGRLEGLLASLSPALDAEKAKSRVRAVRGDITARRFGLSEDRFAELASQVTHVVHSAANVRFRMTLEEARAINVTGTQNVMELARLAKAGGHLDRVVHISTAYVSGDRSGLIREEDLDRGQGFSNTYERSKYEAEKFLRQSCQDLPLVILRPSIIVGDSKSGATSAFNVLYIPLKYMARGLVRFVPAIPSVPLDVVPVDYVCQATAHFLFRAEGCEGQTYHLCAGKGRATSVGDVTRLALDYFRRTWPSRKDLRVRFISAHWMTAVRLVEPLLGRSMKKVVRKMKAFAPHMKLVRTFDTDKAEGVLAGARIVPPDFESYFPALLRYCLSTNWGEAGRPASGVVPAARLRTQQA